MARSAAWRQPYSVSVGRSRTHRGWYAACRRPLSEGAGLVFGTGTQDATAWAIDGVGARRCEGTEMREHVLLFCLLGLVLTATIILAAPGAVTWALALVD